MQYPSQVWAPAPGIADPRRFNIGLVVAAVLFPLAILSAALWQSWHGLERRAEERALSQAALASEYVFSAFTAAESAIDRISDHVQNLAWDEIEASPDVSTFLTRMPTEQEQLQGAGLIRPDGRLASVNEIHPAPTISLASRDYFVAAHRDPGRTHVSSAARGQLSGLYLFRLSRRRVGRGEAGGVIFASLSPDYFVRFFRTIAPADDLVTLVHADGSVLSQVPAPPPGTDHLAASHVLPRVLGAHGRGVYRATSLPDGADRIYAYHRVANYPVFVVYGQGLRPVQDEWESNLALFSSIALTAMSALLFLSLGVWRHARQERTLFAQYRAEVSRREQAEAQLRQAQKLEAVGQLTGGVAHDFNNLLTVVIGSAEELLDGLGEANPLRRHAEQIIHAAEGGSTLTRQLLAFSRQQVLCPQPVDVNALLQRFEIMLRRAVGKRIDLGMSLQPLPWKAMVDPTQLEAAVLNLCINARDAMPDGGRLSVETADMELRGDDDQGEQQVAPGAYVRVTVRDTGSGMLPDVAARAFEPFFTTKEAGRGSGLGLSMVYGFAKQTGGHVSITTAPGQGTTVHLFLPRHPARSDEWTGRGTGSS